MAFRNALSEMLGYAQFSRPALTFGHDMEAQSASAHQTAELATIDIRFALLKQRVISGNTEL